MNIEQERHLHHQRTLEQSISQLRSLIHFVRNLLDELPSKSLSFQEVHRPHWDADDVALHLLLDEAIEEHEANKWDAIVRGLI